MHNVNVNVDVNWQKKLHSPFEPGTIRKVTNNAGDNKDANELKHMFVFHLQRFDTLPK